MKMVVEQDLQKPGTFVAKMYYFDEIKNVARLLMDDISLHSVQTTQQGFTNFVDDQNIQSPKFDDFRIILPDFDAVSGKNEQMNSSRRYGGGHSHNNSLGQFQLNQMFSNKDLEDFALNMKSPIQRRLEIDTELDGIQPSGI